MQPADTPPLAPLKNVFPAYAPARPSMQNARSPPVHTLNTRLLASAIQVLPPRASKTATTKSKPEEKSRPRPLPAIISARSLIAESVPRPQLYHCSFPTSTDFAAPTSSLAIAAPARSLQPRITNFTDDQDPGQCLVGLRRRLTKGLNCPWASVLEPFWFAERSQKALALPEGVLLRRAGNRHR